MSRFAHLASRLGLEAEEPTAFLAPMSGISDLGMRVAAQNFGASLVVSEMIDGAFLAAGDRAALGKADGTGIACHIVQIAGCDPRRLGEAARLAVDHGAAMVDINMGCPAKKVVGGLAGSALMRDLDQAVALVRAVVAAVSVPVSLKMRLGWDDRSRNAPELARRAEAEGVAMITVHGRTRCQFYTGRADWSAIRAVREAVALPVVANGDCAGIDDARAMLAASGADAVMIGRAAIGRPWLVGEVARALRCDSRSVDLSPAARRDAAIAHYTTLLRVFGAAQGVRHARKHLAGYATHAGFAATAPLHHALVTSDNPEHVLALLSDLFDPDFSSPSSSNRMDVAA